MEKTYEEYNEQNKGIFGKLIRKAMLGSAIFLAGYGASFFRDIPKDQRYLFEFIIPTDKGNLEGLISETPDGRRAHFYIKTGHGNTYMESDAFANRFPKILDSIGYLKSREEFIKQHAVHDFTRGCSIGPPNLYFEKIK